jgi:hypothetical protein
MFNTLGPPKWNQNASKKLIKIHPDSDIEKTHEKHKMIPVRQPQTAGRSFLCSDFKVENPSGRNNMRFKITNCERTVARKRKRSKTIIL